MYQQNSNFLLKNTLKINNIKIIRKYLLFDKLYQLFIFFDIKISVNCQTLQILTILVKIG